MDSRQLKDILAMHADQLLQGKQRRQRRTDDDYRDLSPQDKDELASLLNVAERVKSTLKPVHPPRRFETRLKKELLTTAHQYRAEGYTPPDPARDLLILLAAIFGFIIALAGVLLAWQIRRRQSRPPDFNPVPENLTSPL